MIVATGRYEDIASDHSALVAVRQNCVGVYRPKQSVPRSGAQASYTEIGFEWMETDVDPYRLPERTCRAIAARRTDGCVWRVSRSGCASPISLPGRNH
jgi:hypothetical protein